METKKAIIIGAAVLIVTVTIAVLAMKAQEISYPGQSPAGRTAAPASQVQPKSAAVVQPKITQTDSDVQAMEKDLNSVSEEDFNASGLSDQAVGL